MYKYNFKFLIFFDFNINNFFLNFFKFFKLPTLGVYNFNKNYNFDYNLKIINFNKFHKLLILNFFLVTYLNGLKFKN